MSLYKDASLVMLPTAYKNRKLYSVRPTDGSGDFTFSRGTTATRVASSGYIEKGRENLFLRSNEFNLTWNTYNTSRTSGAADFDGGNNAWTLAKTGSYGLINQYIANTGVHTFSVYVKAGSLDWVALTTSQAPYSAAYFDLANGVVGSLVNAIDSNIESVGGGWYRCSLTSNVTAAGNWRIYPADSDGGLSNANLGDIVIYKSQLEAGLVATDYIETTTTSASAGILEDMPRLDYSGGASCPALLLEPQRTNSYTNSEYFDDWLSNRLDRTANNIISPEGVQNAYKMAQQSGFTTAPNINKGGIAAGTYTISIFAKKGSWNHLAISFQGVSYFNLETGSKGTINSNHTATIEDYGNGWYRCAITRTTTTTQTPAFYFAESDNTLTTPDTQGYMYAYGAQLESGSYPTSYIPTYGASVTRSYDDCDLFDLVSKDIITDATEWTIMFEVDGFSTEYNSPDGQWFAGQNGTLDVYMRPNGTNDAYAKFYWRKDGKYIGGTLGKKMIARLSGGTGTTFVDGVLDGSSSITGDYSGIGFGKTNNPAAAGYVKQILVFPTALTDSECIALTNL